MRFISFLINDFGDAMAYYWALLADPGVYILLFLAVGVIYHANSRAPRPKRSKEHRSMIQVEETAEEVKNALSTWKILILPVAGSIVLILLFYFMKILRYLLFAVVSIASMSSIAFVVYPLWFTLLREMPNAKRLRTFRLPGRVALWAGVKFLPTALPCSLLSALFFIIVWATTGNWLVTNIIALCLAVSSISSLPIPNAKLIFLLLSIFWAYDIFWVFISPLIFPKNVMESVAVGVSSLELPMLVKIPRMLSFISHAPHDQSQVVLPSFLSIFAQFDRILHEVNSPNFLMLGLGDIILPGLALNFFHRRDMDLQFMEEIDREIEQELLKHAKEETMDEENSQGLLDSSAHEPLILTSSPMVENKQNSNNFKLPLSYYLVAQVGYAIGMLLTFFMLVLLKRGQPALLYLVPCTLLPTSLLAWHKGQFTWLWNSKPDASSLHAEPATTDAVLDIESTDAHMENLDEDSSMPVDPVQLSTDMRNN